MGNSLFERGHGCGSSSDIEDLVENGLLVTPTNSCMGRLDPARITKISSAGELLASYKPSKKAFLHLAMYRERSNAKAIVHLHSAYSVALSRIKDIEPTDVLSPITAYAVMCAGKLPSVPYFRPSDMALAEAVAKPTKAHHAVLLANRDPVVASGQRHLCGRRTGRGS